MAIFLVDTCTITDMANPNSDWFEWSDETLSRLDDENHFRINPVNYAERSIAYETIEG